jgi:uncharacterized protein
MNSEASVPLFPLPNVILYPGAMLPLHVFEPRYVQLVDDLLQDDSDLLALALLKPGWDAKYFGQPDVFPIAGVGRLVSCQRLPNHRYNILVEGIGRAELSELPLQHTYRQAHYRLLDEVEIEDPAQSELLRLQLVKGLAKISEQTVLPDPARSVSYLCDVLLIAAGADITEKQRIFAILDVAERAQAVVKLLHDAEQLSLRMSGPGGGQPSDPSWN